MTPGGLASRLARIVGPTHVLTDLAAMSPHVGDWTGAFGGPAVAVVRPADTAEAAAVVAACSAARVSVLPQGGNTGLVGGGVPPAEGPAPVIVSTTRMTRIDHVDRATGHVVAEAGVTLAQIQDHARTVGWSYAVDLAARDSATVGGTIATNAGGLRVCAYGPTAAQVLAVEVVLADGKVLPLRSDLAKDNTGYWLDELLIGSEGTLGLITKARLRLIAPEPATTLALVAVDDYEAATRIIGEAAPPGSRLLAAEIMDASAVRLVCARSNMPWPIGNEHTRQLLLIEVSGDEIRLPTASEAGVAQDRTDRVRLWQYREQLSTAIGAELAGFGSVHKLDLSVPVGVLAPFRSELDSVLAGLRHVSRWVAFGHLAEGNLHLALAGPSAGDRDVDQVVLGLVAHYGGSISAEHGIGRAKRRHLHLSRTEVEIDTMKAIKRAIDPAGVYSPGVLLPDG